MQHITADLPLTEVPAWAVLERTLFAVMEDAIEPFLAKYTRPDGRLIWREGPHGTRDGADDFYESFYNWPLLYLLGGNDRLLELGHRQWEATTRLLEDLGHLDREYEIGYDQFHQSESYIYFYLLSMADPDNPKTRDRAERFAGFYLGTDPQAPNYDPERRIIRCAHNGSRGPRWLYEEDSVPSYRYSPGMARYGLPFEDLPGIETIDDLKDENNARRMGQAMKERMSRGDAAANLSVCSLVANAYFLTGSERYRVWLTEYVGAWRERARANGGLVPDNVGLSGEVGEYTDGAWYGSMYGWSWPHGFYNIGYAAAVAGIATYLATGDAEWLEFPRSQIRAVMDLGRQADPRTLEMSLEHHWTGQMRSLERKGSHAETFVVPYRRTSTGWKDYQPLSPILPLALWNAAGRSEDRAIVEELREKEGYDWRSVHSFRTKEDAGHEQPWLCFLNGENPDYPEAILEAALHQVYRRLELIRKDETDVRQNHIHWWQQLNPVTTEALVQLTLGAPQHIYNGGLLLAPLRYFDGDALRPGLPADVAALVEKVEDSSVTVRLVNVSPTEPRKVILQAGTLGEHRFTRAVYRGRAGDYPGEVGTIEAPPVESEMREIDVSDTHLTVEMPPATEITLDLGLRRGAGQASYRFPWQNSPTQPPTVPPNPA